MVEFGSKLREARTAAGLTIADVAERTGLSTSYVSQLERDQANPSLSALHRVAAAVGLELSDFFGESGAPRPGQALPVVEEEKVPTRVLRRNRRKTLKYAGSLVTYELLCPDLQHALQVHKTTCPVGTHSDDPISHPGEELALVLKGVMELTVGEETYLLEAGDTIYFDGGKVHHWVSVGPEELEVLWIITPPHW